jgi:hypothetical protein
MHCGKQGQGREIDQEGCFQELEGETSGKEGEAIRLTLTNRWRLRVLTPTAKWPQVVLPHVR